MHKLFLTVGLTAMIFACNSPKKENTTAEPSTSAMAEDNKAMTEPAESSAIGDYMALKDALVQTEAAAAGDAAKKFIKSATAENLSSEMIDAAGEIGATDDVEAQRVAFKKVTDGLIAYLKTNELEEKLYVQHCPMAFDNTGADWISRTDQIRNPYFGDKMLKCGRVTEEL